RRWTRRRRGKPEAGPERVQRALGLGQGGVGDRVGGHRWSELLMEPQVDAERPRGERADLADLVPELVGRLQQAAEDAEPARLRDLGGELGAGHPAHPRLHDRILDPQAVAEHRAKRHSSFRSHTWYSSPRAKPDASRARSV